MKTIDKTANLSQAKVKSIKSMFKKYATSIVNILRSSGIRMVRETVYAGGNGGIDYFSWDSCITKKSPAKIFIGINHEKTNSKCIVLINFITRIGYQNDKYAEPYLEKAIKRTTENTIGEKYPLSNLRISVAVENPKIPNLEPAEKVANQLCLALKCYNKMYNPETISKIKEVEKRINKFLKEETSVIVESFFK